MTAHLRFLYPFLFAILPLLNVLAWSPGWSSLSDIGLLIALMLAACGVAYGIVALAGRGRWPALVVPLVVLMIIVWFYGISDLSRLAHRAVPGMGSWVLVGAVAALTVGVVWWLARRPLVLGKATTFLALTGLLLAGWMVVQATVHGLRTRGIVENSSLAERLAQPLARSHRVAAGGASPRRDVYLIVLDEYANGSVLRERFGFDNRAFEDSLRQLGFTIPRVVRSNYVHTFLSIPSLLNFSYLTPLTDEVGVNETDPTLPNYLMENNRTEAFLKGRGYQFFFFPSQWWSSTQHNRNADREYQVWNGFQPAREATRSDLRRWFVRTTALTADFSYDADHVKRTLRALEQVPSVVQPTFAFAHILNPHTPYVFDADCRILKARATRHRALGQRDGYVGQVQCLNTLLLGLVTSLIQHPSPAPIILLLGDHGSNLLRYSSAKSAAAVTPAQARERFGAFGAFYLPEGGGRLFADSITLVNVVPKVLNYYFDAGIPLAPDSLYMSLEGRPYLFARVDPASLALPPSKTPGPPSATTSAGTDGTRAP